MFYLPILLLSVFDDISDLREISKNVRLSWTDLGLMKVCDGRRKEQKTV